MKIRTVTISTVLCALCSLAAVRAEQSLFDTPEAAFAAVAQACADNDTGRLLAIFGPEAKDVIETADEAAAREGRQKFSAAFRLAARIVQEDGSAVLLVGAESWPFPIPAVKEGERWRLDTAAGLQELIDRTVGENELMTIDVMRAYVQAQRDYASQDRDGDEVFEYAQKFKSSDGQHDGLYWPAAGEEDESPFGPHIAEVKDRVQSHQAGEPFYGYYYKVLTRQSAAAPGGEYDYVINGNMIAGFAAVAVPAEHGRSGIMSLIISHTGRLYQRDLGPNTLQAFAEMTEYDPTDSWQLVDEGEE